MSEGASPVHEYLIALGGNVPVARIGRPRAVIAAALDALGSDAVPWVDLLARSSIVVTAPVGPSARRFANAAALVRTRLCPVDLLERLQGVERAFGRHRRGKRWSARTLDIDIVLWSGGRWRSSALSIPHPHYRERSFVLEPALQIAPEWRDPQTGRSVRQTHARLARPRRTKAKDAP